MSAYRAPLIAAGVAFSYVGLGLLIIVISRQGFLTPEMGLLMLVALTGLYFGFGILFLMFRLVLKLR